MEYSILCVQDDGLVELVPEHVCHIYRMQMARLCCLNFEHQEEEWLVYTARSGKCLHYVVHINKSAAQNQGNLHLVILFCA